MERLTNELLIVSWDEYFMGIALLSTLRSKDPNTRVGSCIVNKQKRIVGVGYNGFPWGCSDDVLPWENEGSFLDTKYAYVCHAELNAILNSTPATLDGCTMYTSLFPCHECTKAIIQSGIKDIIYLSDKYSDTDSVKAAKKMLDLSEITYRQIVMKSDAITINYKEGRAC